MGLTCAVAGCRSYAKNRKECGVTFLHFPNVKKFPQLHQEWLKRCRRKSIHQAHANVCSKHFESSCFRIDLHNPLKTRLVPGSLPTLFLEPVDPLDTSRLVNNTGGLRKRNVEEEEEQDSFVLVGNFEPEDSEALIIVKPDPSSNEEQQYASDSDEPADFAQQENPGEKQANFEYDSDSSRPVDFLSFLETQAANIAATLLPAPVETPNQVQFQSNMKVEEVFLPEEEDFSSSELDSDVKIKAEPVRDMEFVDQFDFEDTVDPIDCKGEEVLIPSTQFLTLAPVIPFISSPVTLNAESEIENGFQPQNEELPAIVQRFPCGICGAVFWDSERLESHNTARYLNSGTCPPLNHLRKPYVRKRPLEPLEPSSSDPTQPPKKKKKKQKTKYYECEICGRMLTRTRTLQYHKFAIHQIGESPCDLFCPICNAPCISPARLKSHLLTHSEARDFECEECGRGFKTKQALANHTELHSEDKPYKCGFKGCSMYFKRPDGLKRHQVTHLPGRSQPKFECEYCPKYCLRKQNLAVHRRRVHWLQIKEERDAKRKELESKKKGLRKIKKVKVKMEKGVGVSRAKRKKPRKSKATYRK